MDQYKYFNYLNSRSYLGMIYRKFYLYPKIQKLLINPVLDVGCGIGDYLKFNRNATGLDVNKYNIEFIKSINLHAIKMNYDEIPIEDNTFPSILLDNVLEHIEKPDKLICEIHRVLVSEGKLLIGVPGIKGFLADSDHKIFYSEEKLIRLVESYKFNFKKTLVMPINFKPLSKYLKSFCIYSLFEKL